MTAVDEQAAVLERLDFAPRCQATNKERSKRCQLEATWSFACRHCAKTSGLLCDFHYGTASREPDVWCTFCRAVRGPAPKVLEFVPLSGGRS